MTPAEPQEARVPRAVFTAMGRWLDAAPTGDAPAPEAPAVSIELPVGGGAVRELPFTLARPYGHLFGVLAEPAAGPAGVVAVLLNAGAVRRTGPSRMWVELARDWAARGVKTLRLDLEGIGDADGDAARYADVGELYDPHLVDETAAAMEAVEAGHPGARFLLVGLCSGAYWAFHAALRLPRVTGAVMLNPRRLLDTPDAPGGRIGPVRRRRAARESGRRLGGLFDELRGLRRPGLLVFSEGEPLLATMRENGLADGLDRWPNLRLEVVPGGDHTFRPVWAQRVVKAALDRALDETLARAESRRRRAA
jgi:dienelactone hydrolase